MQIRSDCCFFVAEINCSAAAHTVKHALYDALKGKGDMALQMLAEIAPQYAGRILPGCSWQTCAQNQSNHVTRGGS